MSQTSSIYEIHDDRFRFLIVPTSPLDELHSECRWAEGPVWFADQGSLIWSDNPNERMLRWVEGGGVSVFRSSSNFSNGNTRDRQGRLVTCEHGTRRV
ncbi:SMP-30/gluconolactonase/LRE family protein, partial [Rhizobium sp.]|uniref:SMP-30/gluconolactonase/LRE family protein n=1 Tax=Rhizobium sp. TaxID=391 RepID=UPI00289F46B4